MLQACKKLERKLAKEMQMAQAEAFGTRDPILRQIDAAQIPVSNAADVLVVLLHALFLEQVGNRL